MKRFGGPAVNTGNNSNLGQHLTCKCGKSQYKCPDTWLPVCCCFLGRITRWLRVNDVAQGLDDQNRSGSRNYLQNRSVKNDKTRNQRQPWVKQQGVSPENYLEMPLAPLRSLAKYSRSNRGLACSKQEAKTLEKGETRILSSCHQILEPRSMDIIYYESVSS